MGPLTRRALLLVALVSGGCRAADVVTASYATLAEARTAGAIARGRMPEGLPPGSVEMREAFNANTNERWGLFDFPPGEASQLKNLLDPDEASFQGLSVDIPRRIEWWPVLLRGRLDGERIQTTGLRAYRSRDRRWLFLVNWNQGRAYYWSRSS